jgi:RimJ/RimL family protein N-acetyltransferase
MTSVDARRLMRLHVAALFTQDDNGRLVVGNEPDRNVAPRLFFGRTVRENAWWLRHDVGRAEADELTAACRAEPLRRDLAADPGAVERLSRVLAASDPVARIWAGPAFVCPNGPSDGSSVVPVERTNAELLTPYLEPWRVDVQQGVPMVVSLEGGRAVSVCASVRLTGAAHEAGVETHPDFRRRGHAARAVAAWAYRVRGLGRVPLYSTSWNNTASRGLAARLGLVQFGADLHIT